MVDTSQASINTNLQTRNKAVTLVLIHDAKGDLHDSEGHMRNATCQKIDDQGVVIHDLEVDVVEVAAAVNVLAARPRTLGDYNRPDQYYTTRSAIRPHTFFEEQFQAEASLFYPCGTAALSWAPT